MCDVSPARWHLLPSGINVILVSSAQRVGRVSHKTQGFHFINCRVYRVRERVSHKTQGFRFINCRVYRVVERVSHKTRGFHFINLLSIYTTNSITSFTVAVTLSRSTSNATSASNSSATWRLRDTDVQPFIGPTQNIVHNRSSDYLHQVANCRKICVCT